MAGVIGTKLSGFSIIFLLFLMSIYAPLAKASSDGVLVDESTINLVDFNTTENDYIELEFLITATGTSQSGSFSGEVYFETKQINGAIISNNSQSFMVDNGQSEQVSLNLTGLDFGYTVISVGLVGDVASNSSGYTNHFERTIHRLTPLNISIAPISSIILESIDQNQILTGNSSISEGDFLQLQIPVVNNGDYNWTGSIIINLSTDSFSESFESENFIVTKRQTAIFIYNFTSQLSEGIILTSIELNGTADNYQQDNTIEFDINVNPPPLPIIDLFIDFDQENLVSGEPLQVNVTVNNNGTVSYFGELICYQDLELIYQSNLTVNQQTNSSIQFMTSIKPSQISCQSYGQRMDLISNNISSVNIFVEAASFEFAGSNSPSALNGPWHIGDSVEFSLLIRNSGDKLGSASLRIESLGVIYQGSSVELNPDEAGEVTIIVPVESSQSQIFNWSLYSLDGSYDGELFGSVSIPVEERQVLDFTLIDVLWDSEKGIQVSWMINLSEGISRDVNLKIGYNYLSEESITVDVDLTLNSGQTTGELIIGLVEADYVVIRVQELNWTASSSFSSYTKSIPDERPIYSIDFNSQSNPNRPKVGDLSTVSVIISNDGGVKGVAGELFLYGQSGELLSQEITPELRPGESKTITFNIIWPQGDEIVLYCKWDYSGDSISIERQYLSSPVEQSSDSFEIPWSGILGGLAVASIIILIIRFRETKTQVITTNNSKDDKLSKNHPLHVEKIEISCPECLRQLRVPSNYSGVVRCPDCSKSFEVDLSKEEVVDNLEDEVEEVEESASDGKMEISCPDCSQSLRIPQSYVGSVRCPSCKSIFSAGH